MLVGNNIWKSYLCTFLSRLYSGIILLWISEEYWLKLSNVKGTQRKVHLLFVIVWSRFYIFMSSIVCNKLVALTFFPAYHWVLFQRLMNIATSNTRVSWKIVEWEATKYICSFEFLVDLAWHFFYLRASL